MSLHYDTTNSIIFVILFSLLISHNWTFVGYELSLVWIESQSHWFWPPFKRPENVRKNRVSFYSQRILPDSVSRYCRKLICKLPIQNEILIFIHSDDSVWKTRMWIHHFKKYSLHTLHEFMDGNNLVADLISLRTKVTMIFSCIFHFNNTNNS